MFFYKKNWNYFALGKKFFLIFKKTMNLKNLLISFLSVFFLSIISLYFILNKLSPDVFSVVILFYFAIFLMSFSFVNFIWISFRYLFSNRLHLKNFLENSLRQSFIVSMIFCISFFFMQQEIFSTLNLIFLFIIWIIFEYLFFLFKK